MYTEANYIFDEAEQVFEKHALDLKNLGPAGLASSKEKQLYFFSATFSSYWMKVFQAIFDVDNTSVMKFPSASKLRNEIEVEPKIQVFLYKKKADAISDLAKAVKRVMQRQPVLVFLSKND